MIDANASAYPMTANKASRPSLIHAKNANALAQKT